MKSEFTWGSCSARLHMRLRNRQNGAATMSEKRPKVAVFGHSPRTQSRTFPSHFDQLTHIRQFVEEVATGASLDRSRTFDLKVAVSEASANAIEHGLGEGDLTVSASRGRGRLTITVSHPGAFRPRVGPDATRLNRGMGLPLMLALTSELTVSCPRGGGTAVSLSVFLD